MEPGEITTFAPAASDYTGNEGLIVNRAAIASGKTRVALASAASGLSFGVITKVGLGSVGQELRVQTFGRAFVKVGATFTPGTTEAAFMSDADGKAIPATAGSRAVGRLLLNELAVLVDGNIAECIVYPFELET